MDQNQHGERCKQDGRLARIAKEWKTKTRVHENVHIGAHWIKYRRWYLYKKKKKKKRRRLNNVFSTST